RSNASDPTVAQDFVLLSNGNVIEGKATVIGSHTIIDRGDGNALKLASHQVVHSAPTLMDLYRYRQQQRQQPHVEGFQNDARWCLRHHLLDEMKQALDSADELDPSHPETLRLRRQLASVTNSNAVAAPTIAEPEGSQSPPAAGRMVIHAGAEEVKRPQAIEISDQELAKANLSIQAISYFNNRVQPLLLNRCGNSGCHRSPSDNQWQLTHMGTHVRPSSRMTKLNLLATLAIINRTSDIDSDLLKYATSPHGGRSEAPLKRGDDAAVESLIEWVSEVSQHKVIEENITLTELPDALNDLSPVVSGMSGYGDLPSMPSRVRQVTYLEGEIPLAFDDIATKPSNSNVASKASSNRPMRLPTVENPFDPAIFNRYYRDGAAINNRDR
ncbi:MAG TPA: hypothetical protein DDZ51_24830, partial [Planctomycetaceae bacterium]|nr:hypothetical protein [Planctomycetaceae bacterium]